MNKTLSEKRFTDPSVTRYVSGVGGSSVSRPSSRLLPSLPENKSRIRTRSRRGPHFTYTPRQSRETPSPSSMVSCYNKSVNGHPSWQVSTGSSRGIHTIRHRICRGVTRRLGRVGETTRVRGLLGVRKDQVPNWRRVDSPWIVRAHTRIDGKAYCHLREVDTKDPT